MEAEQKNDEIELRMSIILAQLHEAYSEGLDMRNTIHLIEQLNDVNFIIPQNSNFPQSLNFYGGTLLHFFVCKRNDYMFNYLLGKGADYTLKNDVHKTVLHEIFDHISYRLMDRNGFEVDNSYLDSILEAHVKDGNFTNPCNERGITHFHAACAANNVHAIELFLKNGVSASHAVNADSPIFPGYTPLHFAARCGSVEAVETLFRYDVNLQIKDVAGATPLHILVQKQLTLIDRRNEGKENDDEEFAQKIEKNEKILKLLIKTDENVIVDDTGLSSFHVACTMLNTTVAEHLLTKISDVDHALRNDSSFWSGYTALHFAALCNFDTVKLLIKQGANIEAKNVQDKTPFDMCLERYRITDISYIISCHPIWKDIHFLDSKIKLVDFINALSNTSKLINMARNFLITTQSCLPLDSPLWPGSMPLHLAVIFSERKKAKFNTMKDIKKDEYEYEEDLAKEVIQLFLDTKYFEPIANVLAQDAYGSTPIHLAFRSWKLTIFYLLFEKNDKIENASDNDFVSLLHIACFMDTQNLIEELLFIGADANMPILADIPDNLSNTNIFSAGSTPLHISIVQGDGNAMKKLLTSGADPFSQDVNGVTPIHQVLALGYQSYCQIFVSSTELLNVTVTGGVTYLHIACIADDRDAVKKLLDQGADINAAINFELPKDNYSPELIRMLTPYLGSTPLHYALRYHNLNVIEVLLSRGADLFAKKLDEPAPIVQILEDECLRYANVLLLNIQYNETLRENLEDKTGLTMLHIACNALDKKLVKSLLDNGVEVNAPTHSDSLIWPGCTPLHVLLNSLNKCLNKPGISRNRRVDNAYIILKLLMNHGADVTVKNADNETPADLSMQIYRSHIRVKTWLCTSLPLDNYDYYNLNFVDNWGISLFQEACHQNNITVIQEFIKRGVDVNQRVNSFLTIYAGYTPLHFAAKQCWRSLVGSERHLMTIDLLLSHGADVHAKDVFGNTPLHTLVIEGSSRQEIISKFLKSGADVNTTDMHGSTPFELLLRSDQVSSAEVAAFLQNGARINTYNSITQKGCIPLIFKAYDSKFHEIITAMIDNTPDVTEVDEKGRTVIHNIVSCTGKTNDPPGGLTALFTRFIERGCDIDQQDQSGKTALHLAVEWKNDNAVMHLLTMNANTSIIGNNGKTAMDYALEMCTCEEPCETRDHIQSLFSLQLIKLKFTGFQEFTKYKDLKKFEFDSDLLQHLRKSLKKAKKTSIIPQELTLYDFASEVGVLSNYLHMPILKRKVVDEFFKTMNDKQFGRVSGWLKNHYRQALARTALIEPAKQSLNSLIAFQLPHLCSESVFQFLSNTELKNIIRASVEDSDRT